MNMHLFVKVFTPYDPHAQQPYTPVTTTYTLDYHAMLSVGEIKVLLYDLIGLPITHMRLIFAGKQLEDGRTLQDYCVQRESTFMLVTKKPTPRELANERKVVVVDYEEHRQHADVFAYDVKQLDESVAQLLGTLQAASMDNQLIPKQVQALADAKAQQHVLVSSTPVGDQGKWTLERRQYAFHDKVLGNVLSPVVAQPALGVFAFPLLSSETCTRLVADIRNYLTLSNDSGVAMPLANMGLFPLVRGLVEGELKRLLHGLIPELQTLQYALLPKLMKYDAEDNLDWPEHIDGDICTLNICLLDGFEGGFLRVHHNDNTSTDIEHRTVGAAVLHRGDVKHSVLPVTAGERMTLIVKFKTPWVPPSKEKSMNKYKWMRKRTPLAAQGAAPEKPSNCKTQ
jgi:hypothetical protein